LVEAATTLVLWFMVIVPEWLKHSTRVVAASTSPGQAMVENKRVNTQSFKEKELSSSSNFQPGHEV